MTLALAFPTGHMTAIGHDGSPHPATGTPKRAIACHCDRPLVDLATDQCFRCGHYPQIVILRTWQDRAKQLAERAHKQALAHAA